MDSQPERVDYSEHDARLTLETAPISTIAASLRTARTMGDDTEVRFRIGTVPLIVFGDEDGRVVVDSTFGKQETIALLADTIRHLATDTTD